MICDKVTSALDPLVADGILKLLLNLQAAEGVAYLFISHDLATVRAIADRIAVMHKGRFVRYGGKTEVLTRRSMPIRSSCLARCPKCGPAGWIR